MNKLEIACIIIGFIGMLFDVAEKVEGKHAIICYFILNIMSKFIYGMMILLPLYFNYWK